MISRLHRKFIPWVCAHSIEYWYYYIGALFCLYYLHHFQSVLPGLAKDLGDKVMSDQLKDIELSKFFYLAFAILFFRTFSRLLFFYPARVQQKNLRLEMMQRLEKAMPKTYADFSDGDLFQTLVNDFNRLRGFIGFALLQVGNIIIAAIIFIPKIKEFNEAFLVAFAPLVVCVVLFSILVVVFQPFARKNMDAYAEVQNFVIESYSAKKTIKNFHSENSFYELFRQYSGVELRYFFISSLGRVVSFPLVKLGVGASLIWAALIVKQQGLAGTDLIFFSGFLYLILEPLLFLSWIGIVTSQGYAAWGRIKKLVKSLDQNIQEPWYKKYDNLESLKLPFWGSEVEVNLQPNAWSVIIGDTGSGKSYLIDKVAELLRFNELNYSYIRQEPYLYNDTIGENIFLGVDVSEEKVDLAKKCLREFGLDLLAPTIEEVLNLEVGENGKKVSGGQAKRIALIRSLVSDVDFILWDDPFSSVDLILEQQIINTLKNDPRLKSKTFILTSHRLSTVKACDWVIYIEKGVGIRESGQRKELLEKESLTSEYFKKQMV
ncbi:MAG: ABC transporter ATP-binding protein [Bacteriovoracaceae bacterium]|nr:ABC transporter ATP-binding protein [Bacteriovoracaceae bacterium]